MSVVPVVGEYVIGPGAFPTTPTPARFDPEEAVWPDNEMQFESQYAQSWPLASRLRPRRITIVYDRVPRASFNVLLDHWNSVKGMEGVFLFTHPTTGEKWKARYAMDEFPYPDWLHKPDLFTFSVTLEEVPY